MSAKTKPTILLDEAGIVWQELIDLQKALNSYAQYDLLSEFGALAKEVSDFRAKRVKDNNRRSEEDAAIEKLLQKAQALIKKAEGLIEKLEGRGGKPVQGEKVKKKSGTIKANLGPLDAVILDVALRVIEVSRDEWIPFRNKPLLFLQKCFPNNQIYVVGVGILDPAAFLEKDLFKKALIRIVERYQTWFESLFVLPINTRTKKLFQLAQGKIGNPDKLKAMFEIMLGESLDETSQSNVPDDAKIAKMGRVE